MHVIRLPSSTCAGVIARGTLKLVNADGRDAAQQRQKHAHRMSSPLMLLFVRGLDVSVHKQVPILALTVVQSFVRLCTGVH